MLGCPELLWFPRTKFLPPQAEAAILDRLALLDRLRIAIMSKRLTLLSAPAGAGKTTALVAVLPRLGPTAWLSLDAGDDEPVTFMAVLVAALQESEPGLGRRTQQLLSEHLGYELDLRRLISVLVNEWLEIPSTAFVLVLDDLHHISNPTIHRAIDYLIERMPPFVHLAITTRQDPPLALARLRTRGQLAEFTMQELCFSADEISVFLNAHLALNLTPAELEQLHTRTEGWVAAVRLIALALQNTSSSTARSVQIGQLAQSQRFIFDYLIDEVLRQQVSATQCFLLETSILAELTPSLCAAVTGRLDAEALLEDLYRRNLFLVRLEQTHEGSDLLPALSEPVYRYHALFAQFLMRELHRQMSDQVGELHWRAAQAAPSLPRRIDHYLMAQAWEAAADLIEGLGRHELDSGHVREQVVEWIKRLPPSLVLERAWLCLIHAVWLDQRGLQQQADARFVQALDLFRCQGDDHGETVTLIYSQLGHAGQLDPAEIAQIEQKLQAHPTNASPLQQVAFRLTTAWGYQYRKQWQTCKYHLVAAIEIALQSGERGAYHLLAQGIGLPFLFCDGGMATIERYAQEVLARHPRGDDLIHTGAYVQLGLIRSFQGGLEEASKLVLRARAISEALGGFAWMDLNIDHVLIFNWLARDELSTVESYLAARLQKLGQLDALTEQLDRYRYLLGRALYLQGRLDDVRAQLANMNPQPADPGQRDVFELLHGLAAASEGRYHAAEEHLQRAVTIQEQTRHIYLANDARLALATLYYQWGRQDAALATLQQALALVEQRGMPGVVLYEGRTILPLLQWAAKAGVHPHLVQTVLELFGAIQPLPAATPPEMHTLTPTAASLLSSRELEVLQLLVEGLTAREIADHLVIAHSTAKRHIVNLYNKLGVDNRALAVRRAGEIGLP